jgi:hypothetical protein
VEFVIPSLPAVTPAVPSPAPGPHHQPSQSAIAESAASWLEVNAPGTTVSAPWVAKSSAPGRTMLLLLVALVLAVGAGAGAHLGYDWYQQRGDEGQTVVAAPVADDLAGWAKVDPPALRFIDTEVMITTDVGTRQLTTHRDLSSGDRIVNVVDTDGTGATSSYDVDIRGATAFIRRAPSEPWSPIPVEEANAIVGDEITTDVFTVTDLFPPEALPHVTVLENVERTLTLGSIQQNAIANEVELADPAAGAAPPRATGLAVPTAVNHYRVMIDTEAFRAADGAAYEAWERQLGRVASPRMEAWIDVDGVVRQLLIDSDGASATYRLIAGAPRSARFDTTPIPADPAIGTPIDPAADLATDPANAGVDPATGAPIDPAAAAVGP